MTLDWGLLAQYRQPLLSGFALTVEIWLAGAVLAIFIGAALGLVLSMGPRPVRAVIWGYVELFRGTPLLIQLFFFYFGGPHIGITLNALTVGIGGLAFYGGAYFTAMFHAGFQSIPHGQVEAAVSFNMTRTHVIRHIVLPQMIVLVIPPGVNLLIFMIKDTAVLSILTVPELTFQVTGITLDTYAFVEPYLTLAAGYWLLVILTARLGRAAESWVANRFGMTLSS